MRNEFKGSFLKIFIDESDKYNGEPLYLEILKVLKKENGAVTIAARAWVKNADYWTVYFDLIKAVNDKFVELNITIPNQQIDIHTK